MAVYKVDEHQFMFALVSNLSSQYVMVVPLVDGHLVVFTLGYQVSMICEYVLVILVICEYLLVRWFNTGQVD